MKKWFAASFFACLAGLIALSSQIIKNQEEQLSTFYQGQVSNSPGLLLDFYLSPSHRKSPHQSQVISTLDLNEQNFPLFDREIFYVEVKGFINVPKTGTYSIELASDDDAYLYIEGKLVSHNNGMKPLRNEKRDLFLLKGSHYLFLSYQNYVGSANLKVSFGPKGNERQPIGSDNTFLANSPLPKEPIYFESQIADKMLQLNHLRALLLGGMILSASLLFFGKRIKLFLLSWESITAVSLFVLALSLRWIHYAGNLHKRIFGILHEGELLYYLLLPIKFVISGLASSFDCGNLALTIPLIGTFYKYFHFFPGIHYYAILMIVVNSLVVILPWLLLRKSGAGWAGLLAGFLLVFNPALIEIDYSYVSTDIYGFFLFSLAIFFSVKALQDNRWSSYLFTGFTLALLPLTRTVYIPLGGVLIISLLFLSSKKSRALVSLILFASILVWYEWRSQEWLPSSYLIYFIKDGIAGSIRHRSEGLPSEWWQTILWLPWHVVPFFKSVLGNLLPAALALKELIWSVVVLIAISCVVLAKKIPRVFLFIFIAYGVYAFEVSSYYISERLIYPVFFLNALLIALGLGFLKSSKLKSLLSFTILPIIVLGFFHATLSTQQLFTEQKEKKEFLHWVKDHVPQKSIFITDRQTDPWLIQKETQYPVLFEITHAKTFVVAEQIIPIQGVTFLAEQGQIENPTSEMNIHQYVIDGLATQGYHYLILNKEYASLLGKHQNFKNYTVKQWISYPNDPTKGIWELALKNEVKPKRTKKFTLPPYPTNLDRFLSPYRERTKI